MFAADFSGPAVTGEEQSKIADASMPLKIRDASSDAKDEEVACGTSCLT